MALRPLWVKAALSFPRVGAAAVVSSVKAQRGWQMSTLWQLPQVTPELLQLKGCWSQEKPPQMGNVLLQWPTIPSLQPDPTQAHLSQGENSSLCTSFPTEKGEPQLLY